MLNWSEKIQAKTDFQAIAALNLIDYDFSTYSSGIHEWKYSEVLGWTIALVPLLPIPLCMQFRICKTCMKGPGVTKWQVNAKNNFPFKHVSAVRKNLECYKEVQCFVIG